MIKDLSKSYENGTKKIMSEVPTSNELWKRAVNWSKSDVKSLIMKNIGPMKYHFVAASAFSARVKRPLCANDVNVFKKMNYQCYQDFTVNRMDIWQTNININDVKKSTCTFPSLSKGYVCKHTRANHSTRNSQHDCFS